jgi:hypothetical protein
MSTKCKLLVATLALAALLAGAGLGWAAPKITAASADPTPVAAGDVLKLVVQLDDPQGTVAKVTGTVREYPEFTGVFAKAADGSWTFVFPIPGEAPPATYHLDLALEGADGKPIAPAEGSKTAIDMVVAMIGATPAPQPAAATGPQITSAVAEPASVKAGDNVRFVVRLTGEVQKMVGTIREASDMSTPFTKEAEGTWVFALPVPNGAPAGEYHIDLELFGADGKSLKAAGPSFITLTIQGEVAPPEPPAPAAPEPKPDLVATEVTTAAGAKLLVRSPYRGYAAWYKGQLHCHTTNSDGRCAPPQLEAKYRQAGNDWLAITDHETQTPNPTAEGGQEVPVFIIAEEHGTAEGHTNIIGASGHVAARPCQEAINLAVAKGGMFMLNHPDWNANYDQRELDRLTGYHFIEIMNAGCLGSGMQDGTRVWDYVLGKGRVVWGVATDDFHGGPTGNVANGFVMVNAPELTAQAILDNLRNGNFYSTQGPVLNITLEGDSLVVKSEEALSVFFRGPHGLAYQVSEIEPPQRLDVRYRLQGDEGYVRVEIYSPTGKRAWSQPIFVQKQ